MTATNNVENLSVDTCWSLLRTASVGRLAVIVDGHPEIFPINFVVDYGTAVFRTGEGSKVAGALSGTPVAFESDGFDPETGCVWSVVIKGKAHTIAEIEDVMDTVDLPLSPWQAGDKDRFIRITPSEVTGRRFPIADPSTWRTMPDGSRRAATE